MRDLRAILGRKIRLVIAIDSQTVFHVLTKLAKTTEKRLLIDAVVLKQAYDMREISNIVLMSGQSNPADVLTKAKPEASTRSAMAALLRNNCPESLVKLYVERESSDNFEVKDPEYPRSTQGGTDNGK